MFNGLIMWHRRRQFKKMARIAIKVLKEMDGTMVRAGYSRQQRREVWRNLAKSREDAINYLSRHITKKK